MIKKYVKVLTEIDENGKKKPLSITFEDRMYEIDRVLSIKKCASMKVGGIGERYEVKINGVNTYIFFENDKWFVEQK